MKAFRCDICDSFFEGDPNVQHFSSAGVIWNPERDVKKKPGNIIDFCHDCTVEYGDAFIKLRRKMQLRRQAEKDNKWLANLRRSQGRVRRVRTKF